VILALLALARAEPLALRQPVPGPNLVVVAGGPEAGVATWLSDHVGVGAGLRAPFASADVAVAVRARLAGGETGWGIDAGVAAGLVFPLSAWGLGVEVAPWSQLGFTRERFAFRAGLAAPAAVGHAGGLEARLPLLAELQSVIRLDAFAKESRGSPWWIGGHAGMGAVMASGGPVGIETQLAIVVGAKLI
jgi:hypothetical protein